MEDTIESSPTSQKKRKKQTRCRASQKSLRANGDNVIRTLQPDQHQAFGQTKEVSNCLTRNDIWQYAYLMETADKGRITSENARVFNRFNDPNEFRMSRHAGFLNLSQLCTSQASQQPSTSYAIDEVKESQWVTESQFRKLDDAVKEFHDSEMKGQVTGHNDFAQPLEEVLDDRKSIQNSLKRPSSVFQSILSEWPTSPVKMKKTENALAQLSPLYKFNARRVKRKYSNRKRTEGDTKKLLILSPTTSSGCNEIKIHSDDMDNIRPETCQPLSPQNNANDEEDVLNESIKILDNLQNLSFYYTQTSQPTLFGNGLETKDDDSKNGEEEFLGFDGHPDVTLTQRFYEFSRDSDNSSTDSTGVADKQDKDFRMEEDDDIFANFKTQQCVPFVVNHQANCFERPVASTSAAMKGDSPKAKLSVQSIRSTDAASDKVTNIFEDIERDFGIAPQQLKGCVEGSSFAGFSSAKKDATAAVTPNSFTKLDKTENETEREINLFADVDGDSDFQLNLNPALTGFATARGKPIPVSAALISKKTNIFQDVKVTGDDLTKMSNWMDDIHRNDYPNNSALLQQTNVDLQPSPAFAGFATAGGKPIPVSSGLISKKTNIFQDVKVSADELPKMSNWINEMDPNGETSLKSNPNPEFVGFITARGAHIPVSSSLISKKTNIFQDIKVAADELPKMCNWIDDNERKDDQNIGVVSKPNGHNSIPDFAGFTTARGSHIPVSSNKKNIFQNVIVTADEVRNMDSWIEDSELSGSAVGMKPLPISRPISSKPVNNVDSETLKHSTDLLREVTNITQREKLPVNTFIRPSPMRKMSMVNSLRKLQGTKENAGAKLNSLIEDATFESPKSATTPTMHTPTSSRAYICTTPTNNQKTYTQEGRESAAAIQLDDELDSANDDTRSKEKTPGYVAEFLTKLTSSSTPMQKLDNFRNRPKQRRLVEKFDDIAAEDYAESSVPSDTIKVQVSSHIKSLRKLALAEQLQSITKKSNVQPVPSSLFVTKLTSTKVSWKEFVEHSRPSNRIPIATKLTSHVLNVTAENAPTFRFNARDYYSDEFCRENVNGIYLQDDIVIMMDEHCHVGLNEISTAFLSCPSVDPKLIHQKWIENHMKWIVVKLAGMERSFPNRFAGQALTLENLMLQLKYRYEREIDLAERSAIRKICEMDDVPAKRIVLFVARIKKTSLDCEVELSDGWYSLWSTLDYEITKLINNGKIKIGTKLIIQGASAIDLNNGCHPLDVSDNSKLKIHANSTRRARWDTKLGYCKNPEPFTVSLRSVLATGGNVTKLRICVLRVYPVVYINPKKLSDVHSERAERRRSIIDERQKFTIFEKVYGDISREMEDEENAARCENRPKKMAKHADIPSITDPAYLCDLMDEDIDPARIESEMTSTQKTMVLNHKDKLNCLRSEEIRVRVNEKLASIDKGTKKFVPLLRFRITDETSFDKIALVTIWKPTEEILSMFKEGTAYELTGSTARGTSLNELQIYAGKDANFKKITAMNPVPSSLCRRYTSISEILSIDQFAVNELDTIGLVVHVGEISNKIQPVYIADGEQNIICICFWESLKDVAYDDVVQPKRFLAMRNLQWRKSSNSKPVPCTHVTEYSIFTENPQSSELTSALIKLKTKLADVELDGFIEACMEKVRSHNTSFLSTPIRSYSSSSSLQSSASSLPRTPTDISLRSGRSSLSNQSRIEQLSKYGDVNISTPPLQISTLRRSFKLPTSKT